MQNNMHSQVQTTSNVDLNIENCSLGDSSEEILEEECENSPEEKKTNSLPFSKLPYGKLAGSTQHNNNVLSKGQKKFVDHFGSQTSEESCYSFEL